VAVPHLQFCVTAEPHVVAEHDGSVVVVVVVGWVQEPEHRPWAAQPEGVQVLVWYIVVSPQPPPPHTLLAQAVQLHVVVGGDAVVVGGGAVVVVTGAVHVQQSPQVLCVVPLQE